MRASTGNRAIVFKKEDGLLDRPISVPCGRCIGCRLERSRQWAMRCLHEASLYERNCFITLTYNDQHLPYDRSLNVHHFQKFMKRLRKKYGDGIRFFHCGEYGELEQRPHYHACIFNHDFPDRQLWTVRNDVPLYTSAELEELWPYGFSTIGDVTFESAAYVARYVVKKVVGDKAEDHYRYTCEITGQVFDRCPDYTTMSRRPGIGKGWIDKFLTDVYPSDTVIINGRECRPPRFYDKVFELLHSSHSQANKARRIRDSKKHACDQADGRLIVREEVAERRLEKLPRSLQ